MATGNLMPGNVVTPPSAVPYPETECEFLNAIMQNTGGYNPSSGSGGGNVGPATVNVNGFIVPAFDSVVFDYYDTGSTNINHQYFKKNGVTVATLTFAFIQNPVTTANASIQAIAQS